MRVLIYSYNYYPEPIGIAPLMTELAEGLVALNHEVRVVTGMPNYPQRQIYKEYEGKFYSSEWHNGVKIQRCYVWTKPDPGLIDRILLDLSFVVASIGQALAGWRPDVILMTAPPLPVAVPAVWLSHLFNCPLVLNLQDILPDAAIQLGILKNPKLIRLFEGLECFAYRHSNAISVITPRFRENLTGKGVEEGKIVCISNWIDLNFMQWNRERGERFRQEYGWVGKFVVIYSGNIAHSQGLETLLLAAAQLHHLPKVMVVIAGERRAITKLRDWCRSEKIPQRNLQFMDLQPREDLPAMLSAADLGLVIQRRDVTDFNMPSKTQTLMAAQLPIVASVHSQSAAADAINRSGGGLVVEPEDSAALAGAIAQLAQAPQRSHSMGRRNRDYAVAHYGFTQAVKEYESLFLALSARHPSRLGRLIQSSRAVPAILPAEPVTQGEEAGLGGKNGNTANSRAVIYPAHPL